MTSRPADHAERLRALDPGCSFVVEAPAGSGKTALLTQRFLKLLARVDEPEQIVALTFTRKAAQEMRARVLDALRMATEPVAPRGPFASALRNLARVALVRDHARGWQLIDHPARLRIQTIDALAALIARQVPLGSGFGTGIEVLEDAAPLYHEAARAAIEELETRSRWSGSVETLLRHLDNDWSRFEALLADMLARRDQWLRLIAAGRDRAHLEAQLAANVTRALQALSGSVDPACVPDLLRVARFAAANLASSQPAPAIAGRADDAVLPGAEPADVERWRGLADLLLTQDGTPRKRLTKREGFPVDDAQTPAMKRLIAEVLARLARDVEALPRLHAVRALPPCRYTDRQWTTIEALLELLVVAAAQLRLLFDGRGCADFIEVAHAALAALGEPDDPTDLNLALDHRIHHLLVDEFQDTSVTQYELIERLIAGWTGTDNRTVFLVGDPMQSIYRFRQAEVHLFTCTTRRGRIAAVPVELLRLRSNFRTQAAAVAWLNARFPLVLAACRGGPRTFSPVTAERPPRPGAAVHIHALADDPRVRETDCVRALVETARARDPAATVAILVRSRAHLGTIPRALAAAGIPVLASDTDRLSEQPIVNDLIALTRALLHLADRTAWLAVLRAPWCGLGLSALALLAEGDPYTTIWQRIDDPERRRALQIDEQKRLARCREVLARAVDLSGRVRLCDLVTCTWTDLGGGACLHTADEAAQAARYFDLLATLDGDAERLSPAALRQRIDRLYAAPRTHGVNPVEIMTIHRAKGLEFDTVILPGCAHTVRVEPHALLLWREPIWDDGATGLLMAPIPESGSNGDPIYAHLRRQEQEATDAESYRLLYVALTRARETLHLVGQVARHADGPVIAPRRSFFGMLRPALERDLPGPVAAASGEASETAGSLAPAPEPALRRLPADWVPAVALRPRARLRPAASGAVTEFAWAGSSAKHIGTVTHWMLHRIGEAGLAGWDLGRVAASADRIRARLAGLGVPRAQLDEAQRRVVAALSTSLTSERGRWLLAAEHDDAHSEYRLSGHDGAGFVHAVIDRTFIDARGQRWIIDFKTGIHAGGSLDAFLASEVERYRPQLETYAALLGRTEQRPIALGLYFPLLDQWREWPYRP